MTELKNLRFGKVDDVARITFARPKHNVLNIEMIKELNTVLEEIIADNELKCVVIFAEGPSWCAGVDVGDHKPDVAEKMMEAFDRIFELIGQINIPTIAAVHGACLGGGMEVAIACDIIVAAKKASFGQPEIKLGFLAPYAALRLPSLVGPAKTIEVCTTGKIYTAEEAQSMGFVTYTVEDDKLTEKVDKLVAEIQACSPLIIRFNKQAVKQHLGMAFPKAVKSINDFFLNKLMKSEDTLEGIKSFEEKRKPVWQNK